ncbi:MAG: hypothetical protein ACK2UM_04370 [Anaerolineales bacterium]|jgi:hypothetical protein
MNESHFSRVSWIVLGACIGLLGVISALNLYRYGLPTDGWIYIEGRGLTENTLGLPSALQPGDLPISLDGLPFDGTRGTKPESWNAGGTVQYEILRKDQTLTLPVAIGNWTVISLSKNLINDWPNYLIGLLYFVIGIFVFMRRPGNSAARVLLFLGTVRLAMAVISVVPETLADRIDPISAIAVAILGYYIWGILLFPSLLLLSLIFPKPKQPFLSHPRLTVAILYSLLPVIILLIGGPFSQLGPYFGFGLVAVYGLLTVISVIHTLHTERNDPVARAQIRWVGFGVALVAGYQFLSNIISFLLAVSVTPWWLNVIDTLVYLALPITISIAILRFHLFDIDIIIRRTLQYTLLTGLLVLVYFGSVVLLQNLVEQWSGENSPVVIVISTLVIAALFNPLRTRIQDFIDRRFYRKKYDAERILAHFASAARDEVDLEALSSAVLGVVADTMHPDQVSMWLRPAAIRSSISTNRDQE